MAFQSRVIKSGTTSMTQPYHINGQKGYNYDHWGVDLTGFNGSYNTLEYITAHSAGTVVDLRTNCTGFENNSYGNYVLLKHDNGMYTMYAHLAYGHVSVSYGQRVSKGQVLGYMDNTGTSYGGHLHFEVRQSNGYKIDPEPYLNKDLPGLGSWVKLINGTWYYTKNGNIDYSYNGIAQNENGWWKITNGKVDFGYTGLAQNENGWFYCKKGKVDFSVDSIIQNSSGWWKVTKGKVDFNFKGLAKNENGWFYLKGGKVDFSYNGIVQNSQGWWKVTKGKVDFNFNGLAQNENGWFYLKNGKVDFSFNGFCANEKGWWYCEKGSVKFSKNDIIHGTANNDPTKKGELAWWLIRKGCVSKDTVVAQNKNGWWYCKDGKVDFSYNGLGKNENGTWYIKDGKVDFNFNGTYEGHTIQKGKVIK